MSHPKHCKVWWLLPTAVLVGRLPTSDLGAFVFTTTNEIASHAITKNKYLVHPI
jgi:hypothetical protein